MTAEFDVIVVSLIYAHRWQKMASLQPGVRETES